MAATMSTDSITRRFAVACGVLSQYVRAGAPAVAPGAVQGSGGAQQLTIFYGGRVMVLDACPPEKAAELIRLAAASQGAAAPEPALQVDIPIARKASLRRFLAKRKDRATTAAYDSKDEELEPPAAKKNKVVAMREDASSWLALGSLGDMHGR